MSEQPSKSDRTLSEISHLFLSSVRDRQTQGNARPRRTPPPTQQQQEQQQDVPQDAAADVRGAPVVALLASHLGARQGEQVRQYVSQLSAGTGQRIGLIEIDACEFKLSVVERTPPAPRADRAADTSAGAETHETLDPRRMTDALHKLSWEVDRWFVLLGSPPRQSEAKALLTSIDEWTLLTTCDHDGVVSAYRTLKGLADLHRGNDVQRFRPNLSLALLEAQDEIEAGHVFRKLAGVSAQFLSWPILGEATPRPRYQVSRHELLICRATHDKAQLAAAPQWQVVTQFVAKVKTAMTDAPAPAPSAESSSIADSDPLPVELMSPMPVREATSTTPSPSAILPSRESAGDEVIDLPAGEMTSASIVAAVLRADGGTGLVECPIHPPMCEEASIAIARDRRLVLVAVARQGLSDLRAIGQAYRWLIENRPLIAMALPQFAIDAHDLPRLHVLVDHADVTADVLAPMFQNNHVTVRAYRKLRWSGKTGLLLEAA